MVSKNMDYSKFIEVYEGFPTPEISFKDISSLTENGEAFNECCKEIAEMIRPYKPDYIVAPESRGFIFGAPVATMLGCGLILARKPGKLPCEAYSAEYKLEYGTDKLEIPARSIKPGKTAVLLDDLLATGGTLAAIEGLLLDHGMNVPLAVCLIELDDLDGKKALKCEFKSIVHYEH